MSNQQESPYMGYALGFALFAAFLVFFFALAVAVLVGAFAIYALHVSYKYEKYKLVFYGLLLFTIFCIVFFLPEAWKNFGRLGRTNDDIDVYFKILLSIGFVGVPAFTYFAKRFFEPIKQGIIDVIDYAHLSYEEKKITEHQRDELIKFVHNSPYNAVEKFVINGFSHDTKEEEEKDKNSYDDFEENTHQSQTHNAKSDDEFSYDEGDNRFTTNRDKKKYEAACKAEDDKSIPLDERVAYFKFRQRADEGKIKGIKALPKPS